MDSKNTTNVELDVQYRLDELAVLLKAPEDWGCTEPALLDLIKSVRIYQPVEIYITVVVEVSGGYCVEHIPSPIAHYPSYRECLLAAVREGLARAIREHVTRCTNSMVAADQEVGKELGNLS